MSKNPRRRQNQPVPKSKVTTETQVIAQSQTYQGPLPPAIQMEHYGQIDNSFPNRILVMAEDEAKHRREKESELIKRTFRADLVNNICGLIAIVLILIFCTYLAYLGNSEHAQWVAIALVASVAGIFVIRKYKTEKE